MYQKSYSTKVNPRQLDLVELLKQKKFVVSKEVEAVLKSIDRGDFVSSNPYEDSPSPIGGNAIISAPHLHAFALEWLKDHLIKGKSVLDVGSGSGHLTLAFAKMMQNPSAKVLGIEHMPELVDKSIKNIRKHHRDYLEKGKIKIVQGDGRLGLPSAGPFDVIHVGAGTRKVPPELFKQLANGGRLLIPVGNTGKQTFMVYDKDENGKISERSTLPVVFVALTSKETQESGYYPWGCSKYDELENEVMKMTITQEKKKNSNILNPQHRFRKSF